MRTDAANIGREPSCWLIMVQIFSGFECGDLVICFDSKGLG